MGVIWTSGRSEENLFFCASLSLLRLTGLWPHCSVSLAQIRAFEKVLCHWPLGALLNTSSAKNIWECVVRLTAASARKQYGLELVTQILKKKSEQHVMIHHPRFESLANHQSGVKLITLRAVSRCQPGDIYLWTHVSNLAITVPLINSLPESLPGEREFRDSDRLMMLVSCYSVALKLYSD